MWKCQHCDVINTEEDGSCPACGAPATNEAAVEEPAVEGEAVVDVDPADPWFLAYFVPLTFVCGALFYVPLSMVMGSAWWAGAATGGRVAGVLAWLVGSVVLLVVARSDAIGALFATAAGLLGVAATVSPRVVHRHGLFGPRHAHGSGGGGLLALAAGLAVLAMPLLLLNVWFQLVPALRGRGELTR